MTPNAEVESISSDATKLIMDIMSANAANAATTTNTLMDGYIKDRAIAEATVAAIRWKVSKLFDEGFQPSESAIMAALWPSDRLIEEFMESTD